MYKDQYKRKAIASLTIALVVCIIFNVIIDWELVQLIKPVYVVFLSWVMDQLNF